jgi:hypothetical protein
MHKCENNMLSIELSNKTDLKSVYFWFLEAVKQFFLYKHYSSKSNSGTGMQSICSKHSIRNDKVQDLLYHVCDWLIRCSKGHWTCDFSICSMQLRFRIDPFQGWYTERNNLLIKWLLFKVKWAVFHMWNRNWLPFRSIWVLRNFLWGSFCLDL